MNENVKKTNWGKTMIRLIMPCPLCSYYVPPAHACGCPTSNVNWYHSKCGEPVFVDYEGNIHCGRTCPDNKRSIFGEKFTCRTNKQKSGQWRAHFAMKTITAMRTNVVAASNGVMLDYDDAEDLSLWCRALENNLIREAKERGLI